MRVGLFATIAATLLAVVLWVVNCSGPRPEVIRARVTPPEAQGQPYIVEATIQNEGWGHGEVSIILQLRNTDTGEVFREERRVQLESGETTQVAVEIHAPPGNYEPEVEAEYPPR